VFLPGVAGFPTAFLLAPSLTAIVVLVLTALIGSLVLTPVAGLVAKRFGIVDRPGVRKIHREPIPYLGGAAIFGAMVLAAIAVLLVVRDPVASALRVDPQLPWILVGAIAMFGTGLADDVWHIRARHKFVLQFAAASLVYATGTRIEGIRLTDDLLLEFGIFSYAITILWIVGITNAVNFIDGVDGLAASICAVGAAAAGYLAWDQGNLAMAATMLALFGSLVGFLVYNLHPAKIFLGDAGSLFLGFLVASTALASGARTPALLGIAVPAAALSVPILDTLLSIGRRLLERRSPFSPDRHHIHHRLLELGFGHTKIVAALTGTTLAATALGVFLMRVDGLYRLLAVIAVFSIPVVFFRLSGAARLKESYRSFRKAAAHARDAARSRELYDEFVLHFRECRTFSDWWDAVCDAAQRLGFDHVAVTLRHRDGARSSLTWQTPDVGQGLQPSISATIPVPDRRASPQLRLHVHARVMESRESVLRRIQMFGRLMDNHGTASLDDDLPGPSREEPASAGVPLTS
jgi:UDP-N-acetylmuramyl pentapeptide phosphotransferase/UDP-N-acetylglucosamine-1-phosphate transferase